VGKSLENLNSLNDGGKDFKNTGAGDIWVGRADVSVEIPAWLGSNTGTERSRKEQEQGSELPGNR
jgi:hypothetical protein